MATIKIGDVVGAIYQTEQPIHLNPDGSGQATLTYKCADTSPFAVIPKYLTKHPIPALSALLAFESDLDHEPGGIIRISTIYRGCPSHQRLGLDGVGQKKQPTVGQGRWCLAF